MIMTSTAFRALVVLLALASAACSAGGRPSRPGTEFPATTTLEVDNQSFADMTVYLVDGGSRIRLGRAPGKATTALKIPPSMLGAARELQFLAEPLASSRGTVSDRIWVTPGDRISLMIPPTP